MSVKQWFIRDIGSSANLLDGSERQTLITTGNEINFFKLKLTKNPPLSLQFHYYCLNLQMDVRDERQMCT